MPRTGCTDDALRGLPPPLGTAVAEPSNTTPTMPTPTQSELRALAARWLQPHQVPRRFRVHQDTTDFFRVQYDDVVLISQRPYLIRHNARELRYGLEDEVKFWVKRAIDLRDGSLKIMKLVFFEKFTTQIAGIRFECFRSPRKEARILELVSRHPHFMHGYSAQDTRGNLIRILDFIQGKTLAAHVSSISSGHEDYFHRHFPGLLDRFIDALEAIRFLHERGEKHGDIRRDHILVDRRSERFRWIDFDFNYRHRENIFGYDLFGLGNILAFLAGKGDVVIQELRKHGHPAFETLRDEDLNVVFPNRMVNLKKIFPYIPESLNRALLHFSKGAHWFYESTGQLLEDLEAARADLPDP